MKKPFRNGVVRVFAMACPLAAMPLASPATAQVAVTAEQVHEIGVEAYLFSYPLVTMDVTRRQMTNSEAGEKALFGPMNVFSHARTYSPADMKVVVRPNCDTLYSIAWVAHPRGFPRKISMNQLHENLPHF